MIAVGSSDEWEWSNGTIIILCNNNNAMVHDAIYSYVLRQMANSILRWPSQLNELIKQLDQDQATRQSSYVKAHTVRRGKYPRG